MANRYEQYKVEEPKKPESVASKGSRYDKFKQPEAAPPEGTFGTGRSDMPVIAFIADMLRGFNDTLTFGLYNKGLEATGIDPLADEKMETANPIAKTVGQVGGYAIPGLGASKVAGMIPTLARNTIPSIIGRETLASGGLSAVDDLVRTGAIDPGGVALDAGLGGIMAGGIGAASRTISPEARIRAMGNELTPAEKDAAEGFARYSADKGIDLTVPEAVNAVAPKNAQSVKAGMTGAAKSPAGSQAVRSFNEGRKPGVQAAGRSMVEEILGGKPAPTNVDAQDAAIDAIEAVRSGFRTTADPYYAAAEQRSMPPTWVPKGGATGEATKYVKSSPVFQKGLAEQAGLPKGGKVPENSILFLDAVKKRMDDMMTGGKTPNEDLFVGNEIDDLLTRMDAVAPTYPAARDIASQGKEAVRALEAGPLGTIKNSKNSATQTGALFNPADTVQANDSLQAVQMLGDELPAGLLARHIDAATNKNPLGWGRTALPTELSQDVADAALSQAGRDSVIPTIKAAKAVDYSSPDPFAHESTGPTGTIWSTLRDVGKGSVAKKLTDPSNIQKLGKMGPVQAAVTSMTRGGVLTTAQERKKKKKKETLRLEVRGGNNSR